MVQRPRPDLRGGCAAMRIPTATGSRGWVTARGHPASWTMALQRPSGGDLLVGKSRNPRSCRRMLYGDGADISVMVQIEQRVVVEIACLGDRDVRETRCTACPFRCNSGYSWLEPSVEEGIVYGFAVRQEHHSQERSFRFRYGCPTANSTVGLNVFAKRRSDGTLNPLALDRGAIRPFGHGVEIDCALHGSTRMNRNSNHTGDPSTHGAISDCRAT